MMLWRRGTSRNSSKRAAGLPDEIERQQTTSALQRALEARGIETDFSARLAARLGPRLTQHDGSVRDAMADGVAVALELQSETTNDLARSLRGLKEVERMMGAFSGELSKLDEVLEVLAAYVRRMKTSGAADPGRTLH
jgi:hypothetical protein